MCVCVCVQVQCNRNSDLYQKTTWSSTLTRNSLLSDSCSTKSPSTPNMLCSGVWHVCAPLAGSSYVCQTHIVPVVLLCVCVMWCRLWCWVSVRRRWPHRSWNSRFLQLLPVSWHTGLWRLRQTAEGRVSPPVEQSAQQHPHQKRCVFV